MIYVVGSANTDMVVKTPRLPGPGETVLGGTFLQTAGGKGANQAVAAARLGGDVRFVGRVGDDALGQATRRGLEADGIDCAHLQVDDAGAASGVALILVDAAGENSIAVAPGANGRVERADVTEALAGAGPGDVVLTQLEIPVEAVEEAIHSGRARGARVILNPAPARALAGEVLAGVSVITPNETEAEVLTGVAVGDEAGAARAAGLLLGRGVGAVVITLGARGAWVQEAGRGGHRVPAVTAGEIVDTTAAGDIFNGALAVRLAGGEGLADAVGYACRAAGIAVTRMGAQASAPRTEEL